MAQRYKLRSHTIKQNVLMGVISDEQDGAVVQITNLFNKYTIHAPKQLCDLNIEQFEAISAQWNLRSLDEEVQMKQFQFVALMRQRASPQHFDKVKQLMKKAGVLGVITQLHLSSLNIIYYDMLVVAKVKPNDDTFDKQLSLLPHLPFINMYAMISMTWNNLRITKMNDYFASHYLLKNVGDPTVPINSSSKLYVYFSFIVL